MEFFLLDILSFASAPIFGGFFRGFKVCHTAPEEVVALLSQMLAFRDNVLCGESETEGLEKSKSKNDEG